MTARLYVGTYAKYNRGSINGAWIDLEDYAGDREGFNAACIELHKDEADPELMFQDFEGLPCEFYSESHLNDELFAWLELDEHDRELLSVYLEHVGTGDIDAARDAFMGNADTERDWAEEYLRDTGGLEGVPEHLENYIDYEAYARDAEVTFVRHDGELWVFNNG